MHYRNKQGTFNYTQPSITIEIGTAKYEIDRVKHRKASAAGAENGRVVYKKVRKIARTGLVCLLQHA